MESCCEFSVDLTTENAGPTAYKFTRSEEVELESIFVRIYTPKCVGFNKELPYLHTLVAAGKSFNLPQSAGKSPFPHFRRNSTHIPVMNNS